MHWFGEIVLAYLFDLDVEVVIQHEDCISGFESESMSSLGSRDIVLAHSVDLTH